MSHPLVQSWTEGRDMNTEREEAEKAFHFHFAKLAAGMVQALDFPIVLVWALADLWVDVTVISDVVKIEDVTDFLSGATTMQSLRCTELLNPHLGYARIPRSLP